MQLAAQLRRRVATVQSNRRLPQFVRNLRAAFPCGSPLLKQKAGTGQIIRSRSHSLNLPANGPPVHAILPKPHSLCAVARSVPGGAGVSASPTGTTAAGEPYHLRSASRQTETRIISLD